MAVARVGGVVGGQRAATLVAVVGDHHVSCHAPLITCHDISAPRLGLPGTAHTRRPSRRRRDTRRRVSGPRRPMTGRHRAPASQSEDGTGPSGTAQGPYIYEEITGINHYSVIDLLFGSNGQRGMASFPSPLAGYSLLP